MTVAAGTDVGKSTDSGWTVRVEWLSYLPLLELEDALDDAVGLLEDLAGVLAIDEEAAESSDPSRISVVLTVAPIDAPNPQEAIDFAVQRLDKACTEANLGEPSVVGVEAIQTARFRERLLAPVVPPLVGVAEIAEMLGVSRQRVTQLGDRDGFPAPVMALRSGPLRLREQVAQWATTRNTRPGPRPASRTPASEGTAASG